MQVGSFVTLSLFALWAGAFPAVGQTTQGQIGAGTEGRHWIDAAASTGGLPEPTSKPVELVEANARLVRDDVTGIWGVPVSRRGDPDYAPGNPNHVATVRDAPLVLPARLIVPDGKLDPSLPCVLVTNGYGVGKAFGPFGATDLNPYAEHGYTTVAVSLRQGSTDPLDRQIGVSGFGRYYGEDGVEIINWVVQRFGCGMTDGNPATAKLGMVGASLLGYSQWAILKQADFPMALKAVAPDVAGTTFYGLWYPGGMLPGPGRMRRGLEFGYLFPEHRDFDGLWQTLQMSQLEIARAASRGVAVMASGGWPDYITPAAIETYVAYNPLSGSANKSLFIGPTGHPTPTPAYAALAVRWMDRWLKGSTSGAGDENVTIFVQGANRWRKEAAWPIPDARNARLYLRSAKPAGAAREGAGSLKFGAPGKETAFRFSYDPEKGPFLRTLLSSGAIPNGGSPRLSINQSSYEAKTVSWTSDSLAAPTEVTGQPKLTFWASSSTNDADFVVSLTDVSPDGQSRAVTAGYLNGPRQHYLGVRAAPGPAKPLVPGEPRLFTVELHPTSYVFGAGHRIRIAVAGGTDVAVLENGAAQPGPQGPGKNPNPFSVQIYQDANRPSFVDLPVIGTGLNTAP